jgi:polysaccharide biosynthesis protein PslG
MPLRLGEERRRRRRSLTVAALSVACLLAGAFAPPAGARDPRDLVAVAMHPWRLEIRSATPFVSVGTDPSRERSFASLARLGVRHARVDLKWSSVEKNGTVLRDWSEFDGVVAAARRHRVTPLPMVSYTPGWANGGRHWFAYPHDPRHFERFLVAAFQRYPSIPAWEIWNEPNLSLFARPFPDVGKFVEMLRAARRARARAGSRTKLIAGGVTPWGEIGVFQFVEAMARVGGLDQIHGLGIHPYGLRSPDRRHSFFLALPRLHDLLVRLGKGQIGIWATEYGFPSRSTAGYGGPPGSETEQVHRLRAAYAIALGWPWLRNLTWYDIRDDCSDPRNGDCYFGLLRENFRRKPAFWALRDIMAGRIPMLGTTTEVRVRRALPGGRSSRRRRSSRRFEARGSLFAPGVDPRGSRVTVTLTRRGRKRGRRFRALVGSSSRYRVRLGRLRPGRWRLQASFGGSPRYYASRSRAIGFRVRKPRSSRR